MHVVLVFILSPAFYMSSSSYYICSGSQDVEVRVRGVVQEILEEMLLGKSIESQGRWRKVGRHDADLTSV